MRQLLIAFTLFLVSSTTLTYGADLKLKIFFTDNPNIDQSQGEFLLKNSIKVAKKNQLVHAGFIVSGYQLDGNGQLCLDLDIRVIAPDKSIIFTKEPFLRDNRLIKNANEPIILNGLLDFIIENTDPSGVYTVSARLIDGNKKDHSLANYTININN